MAKKKTLAQRIASDPKLKAKYLANPGLRSKLPDSMLSPAQRAQRQSNAFNNAPVTPGSNVTNRALGVEANNAAMLQFGSERQGLQTQQAQAQQLGRDQNDWYAAYRNELAAHAANTQAITAAAVGQDQALQAGVRPLDNAQSAEQQAAMQKQAAIQGTTVDPSLTTTASNASQVRQSMLAGYGALQAGIGGANSRYADTLATVVAPTQQLQARAQAANKVSQVGSQLTDLGRREGTYKTQYTTGRVADEQKNVLAQQALGLDVTKAQTTAALGAQRIKETHRSATLSHKDRQASIKARNAAEGAKVNSHGYTNSQWAAMTAEQRRQIIASDAKKTGKGRAVKPSAGPGSLTPTAEANIVSQIEKVHQALTSGQLSTTDPLTGAKTTKKATPAQILNDLKSKNVDPRVLAVARSKLHNNGKGIGPYGVENAHALGIHVGPHWKVIHTSNDAPSKIRKKPPVRLP